MITSILIINHNLTSHSISFMSVWISRPQLPITNFSINFLCREAIQACTIIFKEFCFVKLYRHTRKCHNLFEFTLPIFLCTLNMNFFQFRHIGSMCVLGTQFFSLGFNHFSIYFNRGFPVLKPPIKINYFLTIYF